MHYMVFQNYVGVLTISLRGLKSIAIGPGSILGGSGNQFSRSREHFRGFQKLVLAMYIQWGEKVVGEGGT